MEGGGDEGEEGEEEDDEDDDEDDDDDEDNDDDVDADEDDDSEEDAPATASTKNDREGTWDNCVAGMTSPLSTSHQNSFERQEPNPITTH